MLATFSTIYSDRLPSMQLTTDWTTSADLSEVPVFVIHNNERLRLDHLLPRLNKLSIKPKVRLIGPDASGKADHVARDTMMNRIRRAWQVANTMTRNCNPTSAMRPFHGPKVFVEAMRSQRSVKIEQEIFEAHQLCWRQCAEQDRFTIVLESDARIHEHTDGALAALRCWIDNNYHPNDPLYVDLAGGCDPRAIIGARYFDEALGCRRFSIPGCDLQFHALAQLVGNTVAGYLLSPGLARLLLEQASSGRVLMPADWVLAAFALRDERIRKSACIHSTPTIFSQGSMDGSYESSCENTWSATS